MSLLKPLSSSNKKTSKNGVLFMVIFLGTLAVGIAQNRVKDSLSLVIQKIQSKKNFSTSDTTYINLLNELGSEFTYHISDSLSLLTKQALKYSRESNYKRGESESLMNMGMYHSNLGESSNAISHYKEALEIATDFKIVANKLSIINLLATEYNWAGDYSKALDLYLEGTELAQNIGDKYHLAVLMENMANLYASQKDYDQAIIFYEQVKKLNKEVGNEISSAQTMSNLASAYADMGNFEYAMFNINASISIFESNHILDWLAFAYEVKGKTYLKQKNYQWALHWYNQCSLLHKKINDDRGKIDLLNGMAEAYYGLGEIELSEKYAQESFEISNKIHFPKGIQKCAMTLYRINKSKNNYSEALRFHEIYQQVSDTLSRDENKRGLAMLKTKVEHDREQEALIFKNDQALAKQKYVVYAAILIILIFIVITLLVLRGQKIQKNLNVKLRIQKGVLIKRELELNEINLTKDKLFSIIGHDLRGPIGALQQLLRMLKVGEIQQSEFMDFIPKLRDDVDHISFTLNNLLSWGQTQMKGAVTKASVFALEELVTDNINLLSEIAENKSIRMINKITDNTIIWSDVNQIDIVIRNLISNALKFTPDNGMVTIEATERNEHWEIAVRDSGIGMDLVTQEKLFHANSNHTTYGTNNEKGTGLGLSLCKEMVEKNNGQIWVESALRKGTCFYFTLPKSQKDYKNVG
ncbi:tetratricopeptide repeat-containing sensor histidine kinase [Flavobacteriaceae bacterium KMM 6897]|nr:tetratricopeptide repeat-containing sensor histidine kinase [Flavobacteriaceae bacterium KMM 6897]